MSERIVVDANLFIALLFPSKPDEQQRAAAVFLHVRESAATLVVPRIFHHEVGRFLVQRRRNKTARYSLRKLNADLDRLDGLRLETHDRDLSYRDVVMLAIRYHVQGKDVPYFDLARTTGLPISSLDGGVRNACRMHGLEFFQPWAA